MLAVNFDELQNITSTEGHYRGGTCVYAGWKQAMKARIEAHT